MSTKELDVKNTNRAAARTPAMGPDQDGRQAARIFAVTAGILFCIIYILQAISF